MLGRAPEEQGEPETWRSDRAAENICVFSTVNCPIIFLVDTCPVLTLGILVPADDVMAPDRITRQLEAAVQNPHAIVGGGFVREPADATEHYTRWCNTMEPLQLVLEQYREITVILPTWFFSRELFEKVGGFEEVAYRPTDLLREVRY